MRNHRTRVAAVYGVVFFLSISGLKIAFLNCWLMGIIGTGCVLAFVVGTPIAFVWCTPPRQQPVAGQNGSVGPTLRTRLVLCIAWLFSVVHCADAVKLLKNENAQVSGLLLLRTDNCKWIRIKRKDNVMIVSDVDAITRYIGAMQHGSRVYPSHEMYKTTFEISFGKLDGGMIECECGTLARSPNDVVVKLIGGSAILLKDGATLFGVLRG